MLAGARRRQTPDKSGTWLEAAGEFVLAGRSGDCPHRTDENARAAIIAAPGAIKMFRMVPLTPIQPFDRQTNSTLATTW